MISLDDPVWKTLKGGYDVYYDASGNLRKLEVGSDHDRLIWEEFWNELHHQGTVDVASYAVVPHLALICIKRGILDPNPYGLIATIEECRQFGKNPPLPEWLEKDYHAAIQALAAYGYGRFSEQWSLALSQAILSLIAFAKGLPKTGRILITLGEDEIDEAYGALFYEK